MTQWLSAEYMAWGDVKVGDVVKMHKDHGPVVEANVDPIFCAHRFEDGAVISQARDKEMAVHRPLSTEENAAENARLNAVWAARMAEHEA